MKKKNTINRGKFAYKTDIGRIRMTNEDQALVKVNASGDVLMMVLDGMGGHNKGDYASRLALSSISDSFEEKSHFLNEFTAKLWLKNAVIRANKCIFEQASENETYNEQMIIIENDTYDTII